MNAKAPMRLYNIGCPMERIELDFCGPYPVSKKGNRYLMVVSCYFTKWVDAIPLKTQEAKYVASKTGQQIHILIWCAITITYRFMIKF